MQAVNEQIGLVQQAIAQMLSSFAAFGRSYLAAKRTSEETDG
jgi:hypothetical protein